MVAEIFVAVPSHARAGQINDKALSALAEGGVPSEIVRVHVAAAELDTYRRYVDPGLCAEVVPGALGLAANRRAIGRHYGDGARVVQIDCDVRQVVARANDHLLVPVPDLLGTFVDCFAGAALAGARLWGVYPVPNALWMKPRIRTGLSFCWGSLFGHVVDDDLSPTLDQKEDYERTLLYWQADGTVARFEYLSVRTTMYAPGGMQAEDQPDRAAANEAAVDELLARWPDRVFVKPKRGQVGREIRLKA